MSPAPSAVLDALQLVHQRMRVLLHLLEVPRHPRAVTAPQRLRLARDVLIWSSSQLHAHHALEDRLVQVLLNAEPERRDALAALEQVHRKLASEEQTLLAAFDKAQDEATRGALLARLADYAQQLRMHLDDEERLLFPALRRHAQSLAFMALDIPLADPVFDAAFDTDAAAQRSGDALLLSQVERVRGLGSLRYALFGTALAEGFGLLRGQCEELLDQQRRQRRLLTRTLRSHARELNDAPLRSRPRLAAQLLQRQTRSALQQSQNFVELLRADAGELQSAFSDLRQLLARSRRREAPLRGPSWQCQLFNLATRTSVKQSMRTAKSFEELHTALLRIGRGRAPHDFSHAGHHFRAAWQDARVPSRNRVVLYFCGGGFMAPPSKFHDGMIARLAAATGAAVFTPHYRLLPEHAFPAALDDALAAYRFLLHSGYRAGDIAIAGDSAGGCLTLSLLLSLRDQGLPLPAAAALLSPLTDLGGSGRSRVRNRWHDPLTAAQEPDLLAPQYLRAGISADHPIASPLFGDYRGLPPILALVGSTEILLDDVLRLVPRARAAAVDFRAQVWPGLPHCWPLFGFLPEADAALREVAAHFQEHWDVQAQRRAA